MGMRLDECQIAEALVDRRLVPACRLVWTNCCAVMVGAEGFCE